jgi:hypothetical protein
LAAAGRAVLDPAEFCAGRQGSADLAEILKDFCSYTDGA